MQDCYMPDGTVRIREEIVNYRYVRWQIYEISHALDCMNEEEMRKVNSDISIGGGIGSQTVNNLNSVKSDTELLDTFVKNRKKTLDEKYKKGLISRFKRYPIK